MRMCIGLILSLCLFNSAFADPMGDALMARDHADSAGADAASYKSGNTLPAKASAEATYAVWATAYSHYQSASHAPRKTTLAGIWNGANADYDAGVVKTNEGATRFGEGDTKYASAASAFNSQNYGLAETRFIDAADLYFDGLDSAEARWFTAKQLFDEAAMDLDIRTFLETDQAAAEASMYDWKGSADMEITEMNSVKGEALGYETDADTALTNYIAIFGNDAAAAWAAAQIGDAENEYDVGEGDRGDGDDDYGEGNAYKTVGIGIETAYAMNPTVHQALPDSMQAYATASLEYEAAFFQYSSAKTDYDEAADLWWEVADVLTVLMGM